MPTATIANPSTPITVGTPAPDFTLKNQDEKDFTLSQWWPKKPVVLYFYPLDWSPTCTKENQCFTNEMSQFTQYAEVWSISVDSVWSHKAWAEKLGLKHPILSDMKREVIKAYGLWLEAANISQRTTVIVDKNGKVAWIKVQSDIKQARDTQEVLNILKNLK